MEPGQGSERAVRRAVVDEDGLPGLPARLECGLELLVEQGDASFFVVDRDDDRDHGLEPSRVLRRRRGWERRRRLARRWGRLGRWRRLARRWGRLGRWRQEWWRWGGGRRRRRRRWWWRRRRRRRRRCRGWRFRLGRSRRLALGRRGRRCRRGVRLVAAG